MGKGETNFLIKEKKEGNVLFNDALNTFYFTVVVVFLITYIIN